MQLTIICIVYSVVIHALITQIDGFALVRTRYGNFIGRNRTVMGRSIAVFLGLPYAEPPVGKYRFQPPQPLAQNQLGSRTYDARFWKPSCIQSTPIAWTNPSTARYNTNEDCLYLNIFTPSFNNTSNLPVFVWIDAASSTEGSGSRWRASTLATQANIIVVTFNYRLGVFGFLTTAELNSQRRRIPANIALLDQQAALRWVHNNIQYFGGNNRAVTVGGDGLGGVAAQLHTFIPSSYNYIHRLILQSGNVRMIHTIEASMDKARSIYRIFVQQVGCNSQNSSIDDQVRCLQKLSSAQILRCQQIVTTQYWRFFKYVVDGVLIRDRPTVLLQRNNFKPVDVLIGYNLNDSSILIHQLPHHNNGIHRDIFLVLVNTLFQEFNEAIRSSIIYKYTNWQNPSSTTSNLHQAYQLLIDGLYAAPTEYIANAYSKNASSYVYLYSYRGPNPNPYYPPSLGVTNTIEIPYVFGYPISKPSYYTTSFTSRDRQVSFEMISLWGNFIRKG